MEGASYNTNGCFNLHAECSRRCADDPVLAPVSWRPRSHFAQHLCISLNISVAQKQRDETALLQFIENQTFNLFRNRVGQTQSDIDTLVPYKSFIGNFKICVHAATMVAASQT